MALNMYVATALLVATVVLLTARAQTQSTTATTQPEVQGTLQDNNVAPFLLVTAWDSILKIDLNGSAFELIHTDDEIIAVDYHYRKNLIFYLLDSRHGLFSIPLLAEARGSNAQRLNMAGLTRQTVRPDSLSVDWINDKVYWTDKFKRTLEVYNIETSTSKVVVQFDEDDRPHGIGVFPFTGKGWLFVMVKTNSDTKLMRITDDGKEELTLRDSMCASIVTLDHIKRKLYWIDECDHMLEESELDGSSPKTMVASIGSSSSVGFSSGLGQYGDKCYYTQGGRVVRNGLNSNMTVLYDDPRKTLGGLVVVHPSKQPPVSDLVEIGGCPSCENGLCIPPGKCSCDPGWKGETCNQAEVVTQAPPTTISVQATTAPRPTTVPTTLPPTTTEPSTTAPPTTRPTTAPPTTKPTTIPPKTIPTTIPPATRPTTIPPTTRPTTIPPTTIPMTALPTTRPTTVPSLLIPLSSATMVVIANNSELSLSTIGEGVSALSCHTELTTCCRDQDNPTGEALGDWVGPDGNSLPETSDEGFYVTRERSSVSLNLVEGSSVVSVVAGSYCCQVPSSAGGMSTHCIMVTVPTESLPVNINTPAIVLGSLLAIAIVVIMVLIITQLQAYTQLKQQEQKARHKESPGSAQDPVYESADEVRVYEEVSKIDALPPTTIESRGSVQPTPSLRQTLDQPHNNSETKDIILTFF